MPFNEEALERYAMKAEELSRQAPPPGEVELDKLAAALGLDRAECRRLTTYLVDQGWAVADYSGTPRLRLTPDGFREIAKLHWPLWRRWYDRNQSTVANIASIVAVVIALAALLLQLFRP
jgi:hypothetical protein